MHMLSEREANRETEIGLRACIELCDVGSGFELVRCDPPHPTGDHFAVLDLVSTHLSVSNCAPEVLVHRMQDGYLRMSDTKKFRNASRT